MSTPQNLAPTATLPEFEFFSHNGRSIFILTKGEVFACGDNEHGQLGLGDHQNRAKPEKVKLTAKIKKIIPTRNSTFFISEDGKVFSCGWNFEGQLGFGSEKGYITVPQKAAIEKKVQEVVSDVSATFFVTEESKVFACGVNYINKFRFGIDDSFLFTTTPQEMILETKIKKVIACDGSIFLVTENDRILACGNNMYGQLGISSEIKDLIKPHEIDLHTKVKKIINYSGTTFFITDDGEVFACGFNLDSSLGLGIKERYVITPQKYPLKTKIKEVITSSGAIYFITNEGKALAFGDNYYGQLGLNDQNNRDKLEEIKLEAKIEKIVSHKGSTFFVTEDGRAFACGWNFRSQLGIESKEKYIVKPTASLLGEVKVKNVIFNGDFTLFITENNGVNLCGIDKYGFIGEPLVEISPPLAVIDLFRIVAKS